ncbi:MAG TPA: carboxypeptidase regulatory-like domain-containing protein [Bryobacteraceae bacterium]|nr:carboxypeptidase regulatory-like domain-containing protein [Bryobacteraceae bacterium]
MHRLLCFALLYCSISVSALAHFEYAEVLGTIRDSTGAVVVGAQVSIRSVETNIDRAATTNEEGVYAFAALRIGAYEVRVQHPGFRTAQASIPALRVGDRLRLDITLETGQISEQVTVLGEATPLLETDTSSRGQVIGLTQIRELPLNKRDYTQLALLAPGTTVNQRQRIGGAININGNRALQNNFLLDGLDNNSNATSFRGERVDVVRPSVDAVAEFKVQTNSYSAEYGRSAGGVVNVTIKSGSNNFRGTVWEFFRNDKLDAKGWTPTVDGNKPKLRFNQFGGNLGGPILRDRTFFFVNYEGERERQGTTYTRIVPTPELQQGNFNNVPITGALRIMPVDPTTGTPFPNGIIPSNRFDPVAVRILNDPNFPKPSNVAALPIPGLYLNTVTNTNRTDKFDVRGDHYFSEAVRIFARYSYSDLEIFRPGPIPGYVESSNNDGFGTTATKAHHAVLSPTWTLNPTTISEFRLGFTRLNAAVQPPNFGSPSATELLGIPNLPNNPNINGGWPKFLFDGMDAFGRHTSTPQFQVPNVYILANSWSLQRSRHSIRTGFEKQYIQTAVQDLSALIGTFRFSQNVFTNNPWGDFLLGLPATHSQTSHSVLYNRKDLTFLYFQDDFRVSSKLTLNLGVRYEYGRPIVEKYNHLANFIPSTGERLLAKDGDTFSRALVKPDRNDWSPRIGLAWTAMNRLVIRAGYGTFYNFTNRQGREGLLGMNAPFVIDLVRTQNRSTPAADLITLRGGPPANYLATATVRDQILRGNDPTMSNGLVHQWNFTTQYELMPNLLFEVGYVGNRGLSLTRFYNANQARVPGPPSLAERRPFPAYNDIQYMDSGGSSTYHSLQTRLEKRWSGGLSLLHSFTWGRVLTNSPNWGDGGASAQDAYNFENEWGPDVMSVKFNSVASWIYQLPFGRGRRFGSSLPRVADAVLGGWEVGGIWTLRSGLINTVTSAECGVNCQMGSAERAQRADVVPGQSIETDSPNSFRWFNTGAFRPAATPYGTAGRGTVYGPGMKNWDFTVAKDWRVTEQSRVQLRGEFFNAFNQVNLDQPTTNVSSGSFGVITSALPGRSIQLGLKVYF